MMANNLGLYNNDFNKISNPSSADVGRAAFPNAGFAEFVFVVQPHGLIDFKHTFRGRRTRVF